MLKIASFIGSMLLGAAALAQAPANTNLAAIGGSMQAAAEACGGYSAAQLARMKEQQRQAATRSGISAAEFDRSFAAGYADGKARIEQATSTQRETMCREVRQMTGE